MAFVFVRRHDDPGEVMTWRELWASAADLACRLPEASPGAPKANLILCVDERRFVVSLLATWMRGLVAIPASGMTSAQLHERNRHIVERSRPDSVLHDLPQRLAAELAAVAGDAQLISLEAPEPDPPASRPSGGVAIPDPSAPALLQFTSGSTAAPKPVLLDHASIAANCRGIAEAYSLDADSVGVHWLPLFHDMGLVGSVIASLWVGCASVVVRPSVFIQRPVRWFELASEWRATTTSAPNFAYQRVCDAVSTEHTGTMDLSCLRNVIIGGEPVQAETLQRLRDTFGRRGLSADALAPSYGLAEVTLLACTGKRRGGPRVSTRLSTRPVVSCGAPIDAVRVTVRRGDTREPCRDGELGEVWIGGDSAGAVVAEGQDWRSAGPPCEMRTGDHGFFEDGELYIAGRDANRMVVRGRNIFSEDVEGVVRESQPRGAVEGVAAFGVDVAGSEGLCILIETVQRGAVLDPDALNRLLAARLGIKATRIATVRRWTLPRTSSGKIRLAEARSRFLAGDYERRSLAHQI